MTATTSTPATTPPQHKNLLPVLKQTFPTVQSYEILKAIVQSNANGFIVELKHDDTTSLTSTSSTLTPDKVFVKQVLASDYLATKKDWTDLRRTLCYARTEARFYDHILKTALQPRGFDAAPTVFLSEYHGLEPWIPEIEAANALADPTVSLNTIAQHIQEQPMGGTIILELVSEEHYLQASPLTMEQCRQCLSAVAQLHAAAWQEEELLTRVETDLSKASFHLSVRNPKELSGLEASWEHFWAAFEAPLQEAGLSSTTRDLGRRVARLAPFVSSQLSPAPNDPYVTLIHGDYKAMNVFLPRDTNTDTDRTPLLVDFASAGIGLGVSDVAMHIHHAVTPELLANGGEEALVKYYWETLHTYLAKHDNKSNSDNNNSNSNSCPHVYPWDEAWRHYRLAVVDYGRFVMGRFWKTATPASMEQKKDNPNVVLMNRSVVASVAFVERLDRYVTEIEREKEGTVAATEPVCK